MRQSRLFTRTTKNDPRDEESLNAKLLIRAGFIHKEMAGVYAYLPLGLRVLRKIENIIREEMNALGANEIFLTTLQDSEKWKKTNRWDPKMVDNWFKTELANGAEVGLANTHEEALVTILSHYIDSHRDLPAYIYQIQTKFRNELRAKSGLMRGREFMMKDMYSFTRSVAELDEFYEACAAAYMKIFTRAGIGDQTYRTFASGGSFSKYSDEFQTLSEAGEDTIYIDEEKRVAVNKEVHSDEVLADLGLQKDKLREAKAIEVGNIFRLGTRFSGPLGLTYKDEKGEEQPVIMGSYGIGLGRLMGTVVEISHDDKGIIWPESVAPFQVHLIELGGADASGMYTDLQARGVEVLYDDRDAAAGVKFADADLIGIPYRAVISPKTGGKIEVKKRNEAEAKLMTAEEFLSLLTTPY